MVKARPLAETKRVLGEDHEQKIIDDLNVGHNWAGDCWL